jgi:hypothetical protein
MKAGLRVEVEVSTVRRKGRGRIWWGRAMQCPLPSCDLHSEALASTRVSNRPKTRTEPPPRGESFLAQFERGAVQAQLK